MILSCGFIYAAHFIKGTSIFFPHGFYIKCVRWDICFGCKSSFSALSYFIQFIRKVVDVPNMHCGSWMGLFLFCTQVGKKKKSLKDAAWLDAYPIIFPLLLPDFSHHVCASLCPGAEGSSALDHELFILDHCSAGAAWSSEKHCDQYLLSNSGTRSVLCWNSLFPI